MLETCTNIELIFLAELKFEPIFLAKNQKAHSLVVFDLIAKNEGETINRFQVQISLETIIITYHQL